MKKLLITTGLIMAGQIASADIIKCSFTEPFFSTTYSMAQQTLTIVNYDEGKKVLKNISFQIKGPGQFELLTKAGKVIQKLTLNFKGSDGMSDFNYPYEAEMVGMDNMANHGIGGCSSNFLPKVNPVGDGY